MNYFSFQSNEREGDDLSVWILLKSNEKSFFHHIVVVFVLTWDILDLSVFCSV
jgi:hypothetical protein